MAACGSSQGAFTQLATKAGSPAYTWDGSSQPFVFNWEDMAKHPHIIGGPAITGSRFFPSERTRYGSYEVEGRVSMPISPADLVIWLPRILGGTASGTTFPLAETLPSFGMLINKIAGVYEYQDCVVDKCIIRGKQGIAGEEELLEMILFIVAKEFSTGTFPTLTFGATLADRPFTHADATGELKLGVSGAARLMMDFVLVIDNHVQRRFANSLPATSLCPTDSTITLLTTNPFTSAEVDLYEQLIAGSPGTLKFVNSTVSVLFTFATLQAESETPKIAGKTEIPLILKMTSRRLGATMPLVVTLDSTP